MKNFFDENYTGVNLKVWNRKIDEKMESDDNINIL